MVDNGGVLGLITKYKDLLLYAIFGVLTTAVNVVAYWVFSHLVGVGTVASSIIAWFAAVLFAYVTNRRWVFHSEAEGASAIMREAVAFFASRLATGVVDWVGMFLLVDVMQLPDVMVKFALNVLVIILNYVASKLIVFRHTHDGAS